EVSIPPQLKPIRERKRAVVRDVEPHELAEVVNIELHQSIQHGLFCGRHRDDLDLHDAPFRDEAPNTRISVGKTAPPPGTSNARQRRSISTHARALDAASSAVKRSATSGQRRCAAIWSSIDVRRRSPRTTRTSTSVRFALAAASTSLA